MTAYQNAENSTGHVVPQPQPHTLITSAITYIDLSPVYDNTYMYAIPCGPIQILSLDTPLSGLTDKWLYYSIDLLDVTGGTTRVLNKFPFWVYRKKKCEKYGKKQLFWLNVHGGFDNFTFTQKTDVNYKIDRKTYKQRYAAGSSTSFDTEFAGERVFNTDIVEEITLRSDNLTQRESQMLMGLATSPRIYMVYEYIYDSYNIYPYGIPVIVVSDSVKLENKVNDKEIFFEITVRYSNPRQVQGD